MNTEQLTRHIHAELDAVPEAHGSLEAVLHRGRQRRAVRLSALTVTSVAVLVAVGLVSVSFLVPSWPQITPAQGADEPAEMLIDGEVRVPIDGPIGEVTSFDGTLTVYAGVAAPPAEFDVVDLGDEQPLVQADPKWDWSSSPGDVPVVYIGDVNDRSIFLHTNGTISAIQRAMDWLRGQPVGDHICLSYGVTDTIGGSGFCGGPADSPTGSIVFGFIVQTDVGPIGDIITWIDVPQDTAVVTLELANDRQLWQRPAAETVFFDLDGIYAGDITITALDPNGQVLHQEQRYVHSLTQETTDQLQPTPPDQP